MVKLVINILQNKMMINIYLITLTYKINSL